MRSPLRRRGTAKGSRRLVTPAGGVRAVAPLDEDRVPLAGGRTHHPNPPRPHSDWYPALDGLGQAALNAEAEVWLRTLIADAAESLTAIRQAAEAGDAVLAVIGPPHLRALEMLIDRWPRYAGEPPEELVAAVARARVMIR